MYLYEEIKVMTIVFTYSHFFKFYIKLFSYK